MGDSPGIVNALQQFSGPLLIWYEAVKRDLPWRRSRNPYHIWVSEIMLQQTRVETVIPYFLRFMELFPTVRHLAEAPEENVLKAWEGLGYYSRARNLQAAAREVLEQYGGTVPDTLEGISSLRGIGPYTAGAILSIAYNVPEPAVDGNVMRVLSRYFVLEADIAKPSARASIEKLAKGLIPPGRAGGFNQALMELGATICTPKSAHCLPCPVMEHCGARLAGRVDELPLKSRAKPPRRERRAVALIEGAGENAGRILVRQRPAEGLLARLWELPHIELAQQAAQAPGTGRRRSRAAGVPGAAAGQEAAAVHGRAMGELAERLAAEDGLHVVPAEWLMDAEHAFSHIRWELAVYRCRQAPEALPGRGGSLPVREAAAPSGEPLAPALAAEAAPAYRACRAAAAVPEEEQPSLPEGLPPGYRWIGPDEMDKYAFPNVFLRILEAYRIKQGGGIPG